MTKTQKILTIVSGVLTAIICGVMNFALIPKIEESTKPLRCFDMSFAYSYDDAGAFIGRLSEEGRALYLHAQLPLDFVYPLAYCLFFSLLLIFLLRKKTALLALPVALAIFDYAENIVTIVMLHIAVLPKMLATLGSALTSVKTLLMYSCFLVILICIIYRLRERNKLKKENKSDDKQS